MKQFGYTVDGYTIPVMNEREIRAAAGLLFLGLFVAISQAGQGNFTVIKYYITVFLADISIRLFVSPEFSPFLIMGRWIVRNQTPEYVGAVQKKFAWGIGFLLSATVFVLMVVFNTFSPISGIACMLCLLFLFAETAFGICIGCKLYGVIYKDKAQYCPGEVCLVQDRQAIQRVRPGQYLTVLLFAVLLAGLIFGAKDFYQQVPYDLFGIESHNHTAP
ncbi:MAG: DUF4395 domain-containing protein [Leptospiraceae bacterium]|nr:DUF4395 domain-containing protein [Leptospiraceae bacterium]